MFLCAYPLLGQLHIYVKEGLALLSDDFGILFQVWKLLSHVQLFATPWNSPWILQARILEQVAVPFSRRSSQPRDRTQVSWITGGFFTSWATREALFQAPSYLSPIILSLGASFISQFFRFASLALDRMFLPSVFNFNFGPVMFPTPPVYNLYNSSGHVQPSSYVVSSTTRLDLSF